MGLDQLDLKWLKSDRVKALIQINIAEKNKLHDKVTYLEHLVAEHGITLEYPDHLKDQLDRLNDDIRRKQQEITKQLKELTNA